MPTEAVLTAQNAREGDIIERDHEDDVYRFRVLRGGYRDSTDNKFLYLSDPSEKPLPGPLYFQIEANEAWILFEGVDGVHDSDGMDT